MHLRDVPGSYIAHNSGRKRGVGVACEAPEMAASTRPEIATANIVRSILSSLDVMRSPEPRARTTSRATQMHNAR